MRALVLSKDAPPRVDDARPEPALSPGEAIVKTRVAGVCDTDLQLARGYMGFAGVPGHEVVGEVVACADRAWIGKRVVTDINAGCGACSDCVEGDGHHCSRRTVLGILGRDGALAERFAMPVRALVEVPEGLEDDKAVFAEPYAAALHVLDDLAPAGRDDRIVVLGDGKLGLLVALALHGAGRPTTLVGRHEEKLAIARSAGLVTRLEAEADALRGAAAVVEATGNPAGLALALDLVRPRGTVILKTTVSGPITADLARVVVDEIHLVGSRCGDVRRAVRGLADGAVDPRPLVQARYPLGDAALALEHAGRKGALKVLVDA